MFGSCTGEREGYFPKCLLLISAGEKEGADSGENAARAAKANPQKLDECPAAVALGINSQFIEIPLILEPGSLAPSSMSYTCTFTHRRGS